MFRNKKIYLDYAGATPLDSAIGKKIAQYDQKFFANPSAIYQAGIKARAIIEESREKIAKLLKASKSEIIFTGSGTESDALAILGTINNYELKIKEKKIVYKIPHIITMNIEHPAVLFNCEYLEKEGRAEVTYLKVSDKGIIDPKDIKENLKENTILVSVMFANNEIGSIQPIEEIAKVIRYHRKISNNIYPFFHTDACQAMNYLPIDNIEKLGVDLMSFNSSKIYGPKGLGVLFKKRNIEILPLYSGGGQEQGLRSGTENLAGIAGLALALEKTFKIREKESSRLINLRDYGIKKLLDLSGETQYKVILNGDALKRLPNNINITILGISSELLVIELDAKGIAVSERSACHSSDENASYVIRALKKTCSRKKDNDNGSIRISLGRQTKKSDLDFLACTLKNILLKYKGWKA